MNGKRAFVALSVGAIGLFGVLVAAWGGWTRSEGERASQGL
jgi:hypothetical protein